MQSHFIAWFILLSVQSSVALKNFSFNLRKLCNSNRCTCQCHRKSTSMQHTIHMLLHTSSTSDTWQCNLDFFVRCKSIQSSNKSIGLVEKCFRTANRITVVWFSILPISNIYFSLHLFRIKKWIAVKRFSWNVITYDNDVYRYKV